METLKSIIRQGEHQQLDFKFRIDDVKKIARTLVAFANTDGGRLLIGVKDNGKITGVFPEEEIHMIEAAAEMHCKPALQFTSRVWQEDMKLVLEITIQPSAQKPVLAKDEDGNWKVYVRRKDHTLLANKILMQVWKYENKLDFSKPEKMGDEELTILSVIANNDGITLSKLYRSIEQKKSTIDRLVALFICWKLIEMDITDSGTFYRTTAN